MEEEKIRSIMESLLFASGDPVEIEKLAKAAGVDKEKAEQIFDEIQKEYSQKKSGIALIKKDGQVQLVTSSENAQFVLTMVKNEMQESLSRAALEVLAIAAYRGPITRAEIELIRGVNCSFTLRSLLMRGLLERIDNPRDSRGFLYRVSFDFLRFLGVENVSQLPDWETLSQDARIESVIGNQE